MDWHQGAQRIIQEAGISQRELMPVFGVGSRAAVGHYLSGRRQPKPAQLKALADYLGVRIDDFFAAPMRRDPPAPSPFGVRYDWSNPGGLSQSALIDKILQAGRFDDLLKLAQQVGIEPLKRHAATNPTLADNARLLRLLNNIQTGFRQRHAS